MDTKTLRHHKHPKKTKSQRDKGNSNVLVIPPDILKKLGISIGNTDSVRGLPNNTNIVESNGNVFLDHKANNPITDNVHESSETSILQTANLMKKSVFLSPTFIPTVANVNAGEIEITTNKHFADSVEEIGASLDSIELKNNHTEANLYHKAWTKDNTSGLEYATTGEVVIPKSANFNISVNEPCKTSDSNDFYDKWSTQNQSNVPLKTLDMEYHLNSEAVTDIQIKQAEKDLISIKESPIHIDQAEIENHLVSLEGLTNQVEVKGNSNTGRNIDWINQTGSANKTSSLEPSLIQIDSTRVGHQLSHVKGNIVTEANHVCLVASDTSERTWENKTDIKINFDSLDRDVNRILQIEAEINTTSFETKHLELAVNLAPCNENDAVENLIEKRNLNCFKRSSFPLDPTEINNSLISLDKTITQNEKSEKENKAMPLEGSIIEMDQVKNIVHLGKKTGQDNQVQTEDKLIFHEKESHVEMQGEKDKISLKENNIQKVSAKYNNIPSEDIFVQNIISENYFNDLLTEDEKLELKDNNINFDFTEDRIISSLPLVNGEFPELIENEILVQIENHVMGSNKNCTTPIDGSDKEQIICLEHLSGDGDEKSTNVENTNAFCCIKNQDTAVPIHNIAQKVNIIHDDIISPSNFKMSEKLQSPVIRALTPVLLNDFIVKKNVKQHSNFSEGKIKNIPTTLSIDSDVILNSGTDGKETGYDTKFTEKHGDFVVSVANDVKSNCVTNNSLKTLTVNNDLTSKKTPVGPCDKNSHDQIILIKDLKISDDIFDDKTIETIISNNSKYPNNVGDTIQMNGSGYEIENGNTTDLTNNNNCGDKPIVKKESSNIRHAYLALTQDHLKECDDKQVINKINCFKEQDTRLPDFTPEIEKNAQKNKKTETNKKEKMISEDKSKNEINMIEIKTNKLISDEQLNDILKSSKRGTNENAPIDKVKEIAEYIKKFAQISKDKNKLGNKDAKKAMGNKKEVINSKSNMIKSKLCIQGVEKPGGHKGSTESTKKTKILKTYTKKSKKPQVPYLNKSISGTNDPVSIDCDVNTVPYPIAIKAVCKQEAFCLCYDFGRLNTCEYDNSYEHIHFWCHDNNADLDSIFSIYNDDTIIYEDRTELDDIGIVETLEDKTGTDYFCWKSFMNGANSQDVDALYEVNSCFEVKESTEHINNQKEIITPKSNDDSIVNISEETKKTDMRAYKISDNSIKTLIDVDLHNEDKGNVSYEVITIIEMEDGQDKNEECNNKEDTSAHADDSRNVGDGNNTGDDNAETSKIVQRESASTMDMVNDNNEITPILDNSKKYNRKRHLSSRQSLDAANVSGDEPAAKKDVKCGVCNQLLSESEWESHVSQRHFDVGWKAGDSFNFDDPHLLKKLEERLQTVGTLKCPVCNNKIVKFNKFMSHIKGCLKSKDHKTTRTSTSKDLVKCGVCHQDVKYTSWFEHIGKQHDYLAWIDGQRVLNAENDSEVLEHFKNLIKMNGCLICYKCGFNRRRAKVYMEHMQSCERIEGLEVSTMSIDLHFTKDSLNNQSSRGKIVTCGVCKDEVQASKWDEHIGRKHNYLAWEDGTPPLDLDNKEEVWSHLQQFIRHGDGLICYKCGLNRRRVKLYLSHIETCDGDGISGNESGNNDVSYQGEPDEKVFECGVCSTMVPVLEWYEHIGKEHNYLAWKVGAAPLDIDDEHSVKEHLTEIIRNYDGLICYKCGWNRKRAKLYLTHIQTCNGVQSDVNESSSSINLNTTINSSKQLDKTELTDKIVQCGVCDQEVSASMWTEHIQKEHEYIAWVKGKEPLVVDDEDMVKAHLLKISRENNGLTCNKCGITKKYPKTFVSHVKECTGETNQDESKLQNEFEISSFDITDVKTETVICGVCNNEINTSEWLKHLEAEHDYMAWLDGRPPLDVNDSAMVQKHFTEVSKAIGGLKCKHCGLNRKYAKTYLQHIQVCEKNGTNIKFFDVMNGNDPVECAVCSEKVEPKDWYEHAMESHYNVAWIVGTPPIEINNPYGVEPYIKEYQSKHRNKLVCKRCGIARISAVGFYAHIITCGKTEEEMEIYKKVCEICNNKYLCIYKSQHMTMHREQEYVQELMIAKGKEELDRNEPVEIVGGRRKAAEKAKTVIEKYTSNKDEDGIHCPKCGFTCDSESEMPDHVCVGDDYLESDSEASVDLNNYSSDDDDMSDVDSNISEEERLEQYEETKSKKHGDSCVSSKIQRLPYQVANLNTYMRKSAEEFVKLHLTNDDLFPQWRSFDYEIVPEADVAKYMPPLQESCNVRFSAQGDWMTYKRFEAKKENGVITMFMGACIQNVCWVPPRLSENEGTYKEYMSVLTHLGSDTPKHFWHDKPSPQPALIQLWDCGNLVAGVPEFVMGLALDCGVIWAMDWCPSGARDVLDVNEKVAEPRRLGLLAVASANGSAYIYAMHDPSYIKKGQVFCKLKPVAEMRLAMKTDRRVYQATAIKWSTQKGHAHIVVGYSDGTVAHFDLSNESPLLKTSENGVKILYPFHDERVQNMCIEDVDVFPSSRWSGGGGGVAAAGAAGAVCRAAPPAAARPAPAHLPAARVLFPPHWPAPLLAGDDYLVWQAVNEVEWYGGGRRAGGMRALGGCAWCGRVAAAAAPLLRLVRAHPAYTDLHRQIIATLQMIPFGNKRKRKNDELSMIMEPLSYDDAVSKYGIEFQSVVGKDKNTQQKLSNLPRDTLPERFPLSDVVSMKFCPSARNHQKLSVATHAGIMFIINT